MTTDLDPIQRRDALIAALDWVGAYEGTHPADGQPATIEQGARDVPQDLLDAFVVLQDLLDQSSRAIARAEFLALVRTEHQVAPDSILQKHATAYAEKVHPVKKYQRLVAADDR